MVVDTSALVAIIRDEPERTSFLRRLAEAADPQMLAVTWMEARMVALSRTGDRGLDVLNDLVAQSGIRVVPVSPELADRAFSAFRRYCKGRHPARLNFGDCFSYALASETERPLLFKGDDFSKTDVLAVAHGS